MTHKDSTYESNDNHRAGIALRSPYKRTLPLGSIEPEGWLRRQLELQAAGITGQLERIWGDVGPNSGWLGGSGEDWERGPYYLDGLIPLAHVLDDERLKDLSEKWIEWILNSQQPNGQFGPPSNDDWWPRMVALKVLTQYAEATGDPRVIPFMEKYFRYQLEHLPGRPLSSWGRARGADNTLSVWWLYERTGEDWLLELIRVIDDQSLQWNEYLNTDLITGKARVFKHETHGPNVAMGLKKGAIDWILDGNDAHQHETEDAFTNVLRWHGQAHGWFSGDEWLGGREATAGIETCQVVEMMYTCEILTQTFGDGFYGDRLESLAFNLLPASCDPRMLSHQYHQQGTQIACSVAKRDWSFASDDSNVFGLEPNFGCCTANLHQGWPKFVSSLWMRGENSLRVAAYAPCRVSTDIKGSKVDLSVKTDYPFREAIHIHVDTESERPFGIELRIPEWSKDWTIRVDGRACQNLVPEGGYVRVDRSWLGGGDIELVFPMVPRVERRERQAATVHYGPLTLVRPIGENWIPIPNSPGLGEWHIYPRGSWSSALASVENTEEWKVTRQEVGEVPFGLVGPHGGEGSPLTIVAPGAAVDSWTTDGASASVPPNSPVLDHGPIHDNGVHLVPYGNARLRIMEFPVLGDPNKE